MAMAVRRSQRLRCSGIRCFYNRAEELQGLGELTRKGKLVLLVGPPDSGKSALLREFARRQQLNRTGYPIAINMREGQYNSAASFAAQLKASSSAFTSAARAVSAMTIPSSLGRSHHYVDHIAPGTKVAAALATGKAADAVQQVERSDMMSLLGALTALFENWKVVNGSSSGFPSIIIDEANRLHEWNPSEEEQMNLATLQAFFIMLTKETQVANVILATSQDFFRVWLDSHVGLDRYEVGVVGDLVEEEARTFFREELAADFPEDLWENIYWYVGGRILLLKTVAENLSCGAHNMATMRSRWLNWKLLHEHRSFREVAAPCAPTTSLPSRLKSTTPVLWTREDYVAVLEKITEAEGGVVSENELLDGQILSKEALYSLVEHNYLHWRHVGLWAKDLSWYKGVWPIIMPLSKPRFHAMKRVLAHYEGDTARLYGAVMGKGWPINGEAVRPSRLWATPRAVSPLTTAQRVYL